MERLTNEQLEAIRKRAEADKDFDIFGDVPKLLAEIDRLKEENRVIIESIFGDAMRRSAESNVKSIREKIAEAIAND